MRPGGAVLLQQEIPGTRHTPATRERERGTMVISDVQDLADGVQAATLTHTIDGRSWSQRIVTKNLSEDALDAQLAAAGLRRTRYLTPDKMWVRAELA